MDDNESPRRRSIGLLRSYLCRRTASIHLYRSNHIGRARLTLSHSTQSNKCIVPLDCAHASVADQSTYSSLAMSLFSRDERSPWPYSGRRAPARIPTINVLTHVDDILIFTGTRVMSALATQPRGFTPLYTDIRLRWLTRNAILAEICRSFDTHCSQTIVHHYVHYFDMSLLLFVCVLTFYILNTYF